MLPELFKTAKCISSHPYTRPLDSEVHLYCFSGSKERKRV